MISKKHVVVISLLLLCKLSVVMAARDDVLIIVNDNSLDSPQIGVYYAQQRDINPANIVHIKVPDSYFISWSDFRSMRDQLIRFMQLNTLDDPALVPVICTDGEPPYYCKTSMDQLLAHTTIRYLVTTRGVPTRMTVDGSTLRFPSAPTSVDNYLKYWLINYFTDDVQLTFTERELAFAGGSGMRTVQPATDRELIIGRIDGLDLNAARALVDRAIAVENAGIFGSWYGSTQFWRWRDRNTGQVIYPLSGSSQQGWRYGLGMWREDRVECAEYLNFSGSLAEGKAPAHCRLQLNDDSDPDLQFTQGINYPAPGNSQSRVPLVIDALGYQGWLDGQATLGSFAALLNWRKNGQCSVMLCDNAADPASCQANSSDIFGELNTDCVGVADGFMGYNHQSWPMSYLAIWPTGWFQSSNTGNSGWNDGGHGDLNQLAFPEVSNDEGFDDNNSLWFRNTDQIPAPLCYAGRDFSVSPSVPCVDQRRLVLSQKITLAPQTLDTNSPQTYRVSLRYKIRNIKSTVDLRVRLFIHETGAGNAQIDYGVQTLATLTPVATTGWVTAEAFFTLNPSLHNTSSYDGLKITFDTPNAFAGDLGIDVVSVQETTAALELVSNSSFSLGHHQVASGDHAANFLNRLGGVAAWGSVGHHQSAGCAFCFNGLESMIYFLRGLPLGDAVWFSEAQNSGILYGDPLYSPVAVRLNPLNSVEIQNGSVDLVGSTVNGRDLLQVNTNYTVDVCTADDFYVCDQAQSWQATGISGPGGSENILLGTLDTTLLATDDFTLRLQVSSLNTLSGNNQVIADYFTMSVNDPPVAMDASLNVVVGTNANGVLAASDEEGDALIYSITSNGSKGTATVLNPVSGSYRYTPNANATGTDSFTFKVNDGQQDSNIATVSINITGVNNAPVAVTATLNTNEDTTATAVLSASDIDGDALIYSIVTNAAKGAVLITNASAGAYSYTPNANANGADSFTFKVSDGLMNSNIATLNVSITAVNDAPVPMSVSTSIVNNAPETGTLSAVDADGDSLIFSLVSNAGQGTVVISNASTGFYTYTPNPGAVGTDSFTYQVSDGQVNSDIAVVTFKLRQVDNVQGNSVASGGSLNFLFLLWFALLPSLRFIPVGRMHSRTFFQG